MVRRGSNKKGGDDEEIDLCNNPTEKLNFCEKNKDKIKTTTACNRAVAAICEEKETYAAAANMMRQDAGKPKNKKLCDCTVKELKERAKAKKLTGYSTMNKAELMSALRRK